MSDVNHAPVSYPPQFPTMGRLPNRPVKVQQNLLRQRSDEREYKNSLSLEAGARVVPPCCKTLHVTLCFDGTGNNLHHDLYEAEIAHPTNISRIFRASIGDGIAGGTAHNGSIAQGLTDPLDADGGNYFKYYMPGVGTPFAEVGDLDYSTLGLALALRGEHRLNWALLMLVDALRRSLKIPRLSNVALRKAVDAMGSTLGLEWATGHANRAIEFRKQLWALEKPLRMALTQPYPGQPKLMGLKLYIYGFSRGAAAARAFVNWVNRLLSHSDSKPAWKQGDLVLPISVEYLGLLDTVASVGIADILPGTSGHMGWADDNQQLPEGQLVKRCLHLVAGHEQRLCFPVESIRRASGEYPTNATEVIYPGVHSDVGGGYPPGDQGKAISKGKLEHDSQLLSQIALHDLYADAFAHGAPLKVPAAVLPPDLRDQTWRSMTLEVAAEFDITPILVNRFNAWRQVTLNLAPSVAPLSREKVELYQPSVSNVMLEEAMRNQMDWFTAWRIDRYAFLTLKSCRFFDQASDTHADPEALQQAKDQRERDQDKITEGRRTQLALERLGTIEAKPLEPGEKDFDPDLARTQLLDGAIEFGKAYRRATGFLTVVVPQRTLITPRPINVTTHAAYHAERRRMTAAGYAKVRRLFPPPPLERNHHDEHRRGNVDEASNASEPEGLLRALFDDQVHDSRAWFLYSRGREPFGSYLAERMVFFGDTNRRELVAYREDKTGTMVQVNPASSSAQPQIASIESTPVGAEQTAEGMKAVEQLWADYHAKMKEVQDAQA